MVATALAELFAGYPAVFVVLAALATAPLSSPRAASPTTPSPNPSSSTQRHLLLATVPGQTRSEHDPRRN